MQCSSFSQAFSSTTANVNDDGKTNSKEKHKDEHNIVDSKPPVLQQKIDKKSSSDASSSLILLQQQPHVLHISTRQRGSPVLRYLRNVPFAYVSDLKPDYLFNAHRCALFLSIKYHNLYPTYIHRRIAMIQKDYDLRVLLCLEDVEDNAKPILV